MKTELTSYAGTFASITAEDDALALRFHRGFTFALNADEPILVIRLRSCPDAVRAEQGLSAFLGEEVDGLAVDRTKDNAVLTIDFCWANDGQSYAVSAKGVDVSSEPYSMADYRNQIVLLEGMLRAESKYRHILATGIQKIQARLQEDVLRLKIKRDFFLGRNDSKAETQAAVADALNGVIQRLKECEQHAGQVSSETAPSAASCEPSA